MNLSDKIEKLYNRCIGCGKCSKVCQSLKHGEIDHMEVMMGGEAEMASCICCSCCFDVCRKGDFVAVMKDLIAMDRDIHVSRTFRDSGYVMPPLSPCRIRCGPASA